MSNDVDRILAAIPIETYIQRFVPLKRKGSNYWGLCPFHSEKTPSFSVAPEKGIFKCFGCGKGGNLLTFVQEYERVPFVQALQILSEYSGIPLAARSAEKNEKEDSKKELVYISSWAEKLFARSLPDSEAQAYLNQRGIGAETVAHFKLGYHPAEFHFLEKQAEQYFKTAEQKKKALDFLAGVGLLGKNESGDVYNRFRDRLIFPIYSLRGECIAFGGRILREKENTGKYINSPESDIFQKKNTLYHLYEASASIREAGQVILVEGYFDVIGLYQAGVKNAVAPLGTSFTEEQARLLKRYSDQVLVFFDSDRAGVDASFKALQICRRAQLSVRVLVQEGRAEKSDPFDLARKLDRLDLMTLLDGARSELSFVLWYFFSYKFDISQLDDKRRAIADFFSFLLQLEQSWEKEEYLAEAATVLRLNKNILFQDFKKISQGQSIEPRLPKAERPKPVVTSISAPEKELLAILLRFPSFWEKDALLQEIRWQSEQTYLLYSFFRDRFRAGEVWAWENIQQAMIHLPQELASLLSGIIMQYERAFDEPHFEKENERARHYAGYFQSQVFHLKKQYLEGRLRELQQKLGLEESLQGAKVDYLTGEINALIQEIQKINAFLLAKKQGQ